MRFSRGGVSRVPPAHPRDGDRGRAGPSLTTRSSRSPGHVGDHARLARGQLLSLRRREYVEAARSIGASPTRSSAPPPAERDRAAARPGELRHGAAIIAAAGLSFIGFGPSHRHRNGADDQRRPELHQHAACSRSFRGSHPILRRRVHVLGDGLCDISDPRLREQADGVRILSSR